MIEIRKAKMSEFVSIKKFLARNYGETHGLVAQQKLFLWQYGSNSQNTVPSDSLNLLIALHKSNVVGIQGLIFNRFRLIDKCLHGVWLSNLIVEENYRSLGAGLLLMSEVHKLPVDIIATIGINAKLFPFYEKNKFHTVFDISRFIIVIDINKFGNIAKKQVNEFPLPNRVKNVIGKFSFTESFDGKWDALYRSIILKKNYIGVERTNGYMNWRYSNHPVFRYKILSYSKEGTLYDALAIYRIEVASDSELKIMRVMEIWANHVDDTLFISSKLVEIAQNSEVVFIDIFCNSKSFFDQLLAAGWQSAASISENLPYRFQPTDFEITNMPIAIKSASFDIRDKKYSDYVYVVKSDGDMDRPK